MMRILLSALLVTAGLAAFAPSASATCLDTTPDDDGVGTTNCNVPVVGDCHVLVYGSLPGLSNGCSPIVCVRECVPYECVQDCDGPPEASASPIAGPCSNDLNPTDDNGVTVRCTAYGITCTVNALRYGSLDPVQGPYCSGPIYCVTDPCWPWL